MMYSDSMFNFYVASQRLDVSIENLLEILDLTPEEAEQENLSVHEIIHAVEDTEFAYDDWTPGCDSIAAHCESYPYN